MESKKLIIQTQILETQRGQKIILVKLRGYFNASNEEEKAFEEIIKKNANIILDFAEVTGIYSDFFPAFLIKLQDKAQELEGKMVLVSMPPGQVFCFEMLGLKGFFEIRETVEEALLCFGTRPK